MNNYGLEALRNKRIKIIGQKQLNELNVGDIFIYNNMLCRANIVSKYYVNFENNIRQDFSTTRVLNKVSVVEWVEKMACQW